MKALSLGLAGGVVWGLAIFVTTLISMGTAYGDAFLTMLASIYPGFAISVPGAFLGFAYGFVDAFIGLVILAWLYKAFSGCIAKCREK